MPHNLPEKVAENRDNLPPGGPAGDNNHSDSDDFNSPKPIKGRESRKRPIEEDGNKWFKGPLDNSNFSKLTRVLRNLSPDCLQTKSVSPSEIRMNKVIKWQLA